MKFFIDTANLNEIQTAQALGFLDGVTTNLSLMAKEGINGKENVFAHYKLICEIVTGDESSEVVSTDYKEILKDSIFETSPRAATIIQFEENNEDLLVEGFFFKGKIGIINLDADDKTITIGKNFGAKVMESKDGGKYKYRNYKP